MIYTLYKITNKTNGMIYVGYHKTTNIDDGYMGSGRAIKEAIENEGIDNFAKEIISYFDDECEMKQAEKNMVNKEFVGRGDTYNLKVGGHGGFRTGFVTTSRNKSVSSERFYSEKLRGVQYGKCPVLLTDGSTTCVGKESIPEGAVPTFHKHGTVKVLIDGKHAKVSKEEYQTGDYIHPDKGRILVRDKDDNYFRAEIGDERLMSGEVVPATTGQNNNPSEYLIFDSKNKIKFSVKNENFINFCRRNGLPYGALTKSHRAEGTPIYKKIGSNKKRMEKNNMFQYEGWYAKRIK